MASYHLSNRAEKDLDEIADFTLRAWGKAQVIRYLDDLEAFCQVLADNPRLGRKCDYIRPGLRGMERGSHVIFYRQVRGGILVSRILHKMYASGKASDG